MLYKNFSLTWCEIQSLIYTSNQSFYCFLAVTELLNANSYNPVEGAGEQGQPVYPVGPEVIKAKMLYSINR